MCRCLSQPCKSAGVGYGFLCIYIGSRSVLKHCRIIVTGNNVRLKIMGGTLLKNVRLIIKDDNGEINIGSNFTMEGGTIEALEGKKVEIGEDCMFSSGIDIITADYHVIFKKATDERLNSAKDIIINSHVWLCANVKVLKESRIPDNCVVGTGTIVNGELHDSHAYMQEYRQKKSSRILIEKEIGNSNQLSCLIIRNNETYCVNFFFYTNFQ